jgi:UDP-N-acetylmuramyl pentapeptide phosphotransferase/UDP-N-acetylglucosamine-1-phosphate transferase
MGQGIVVSNVVLVAVAFGTAVLVTPLVRAAARRWGVVDHPGPRSSHVRVTPRGGGLAILVALGLSLALTAPSWRGTRGAAAFLLGCLALGAVGLWDDRRSLSPATRLGFHVLAAAALVWATGGLSRLPLPPPVDFSVGWLGSALAVLWVVAVVNFYNFLDGIDGLAGLQAVVTGTGFALAGLDPVSSAVGAAIAGAGAGFLVYNWSPASIFMGDVGSGVLGYAFAALPFLAPPGSRPPAVLFAALSLWLFLADATWTLARRAARGERLHQAHREHLYQRLVATGWGHAGVALGMGLAAAVLTAAALAALRSTRPAAWWAAVVLALLAVGAEVLLVRQRELPAGARRGRDGDDGHTPASSGVDPAGGPR